MKTGVCRIAAVLVVATALMTGVAAGATSSVTITSPKAAQSISLKKNPYLAVAGGVTFAATTAGDTTFYLRRDGCGTSNDNPHLSVITGTDGGDGCGLIFNAIAGPVGDAENGRAAIAQARELQPDVVVMDLVMPELDGIAATEALREQAPDVKVLALSTFNDEDHVLPTLAAGASGFLTKDTRPEEIAHAIRSVFRGDPVLCTEATRRVLRRVHGEHVRPEGTVTVLFTDIESSTPLVERLGDEQARELFLQHDRIVRETLERTGGIEVEREATSSCSPSRARAAPSGARSRSSARLLAATRMSASAPGSTPVT